MASSNNNPLFNTQSLLNKFPMINSQVRKDSQNEEDSGTQLTSDLLSKKYFGGQNGQSQIADQHQNLSQNDQLKEQNNLTNKFRDVFIQNKQGGTHSLQNKNLPNASPAAHPLLIRPPGQYTKHIGDSNKPFRSSEGISKSTNNLSKISSTLAPGERIVPNLEKYSRNLIEQKNEVQSEGAHPLNFIQDRIALKEQLMAKKRQDTWYKALKECLNLNNFQGLTPEQINDKFPVLANNSVAQIHSGKFKQSKVPVILLEVMRVEVVGNCYQIRCQDLSEEVIECTFHSDCKPIIQRQVRKGRILHLTEPVVYSLGVVSQNSNLVVMKQCIRKIVK